MPKASTPSARVDRSGVEGDFNIYRHERKNDSPDRAVLLYTVEALATLNEEGWPIRPGDLGENLTLQGVVYDDLRPGTEWRIGADLLIRVAEPCNPCKNLARLPYIGEEKKQAFIQTLTGRRGWYARVLREGVVNVGDPFTTSL